MSHLDFSKRLTSTCVMGDLHTPRASKKGQQSERLVWILPGPNPQNPLRTPRAVPQRSRELNCLTALGVRQGNVVAEFLKNE